jgi:hypothetical protein
MGQKLTKVHLIMAMKPRFFLRIFGYTVKLCYNKLCDNKLSLIMNIFKCLVSSSFFCSMVFLVIMNTNSVKMNICPYSKTKLMLFYQKLLIKYFFGILQQQGFIKFQIVNLNLIKIIFNESKMIQIKCVFLLN